MKVSYNEFHVSRSIRDICGFSGALFASTGNAIFADMANVRQFAEKLNNYFEERGQHDKRISAGNLNAMGLIDEIFHYVCMIYRRDANIGAVSGALTVLDEKYGYQKVDELLVQFNTEFPPTTVYKGVQTPAQYLAQQCIDIGTNALRSNRESTLEEMILLHLANENPAFGPFKVLFDDAKLSCGNPLYSESWKIIQAYFKTQPVFGPFSHELITLLREPVVFSPGSLKGQLDYIKTHWTRMLGAWLKRLLAGIDTISEEEKAAWHPIGSAGPDMAPYSYDMLQKEYERFSPDRDWMPRVVLMAKTVLVWLDQLSRKYKRQISRLDQIPDEELDALADEGFTGLWLIGLWERSYASKRIKQLCGNPEAAASAYSLYDYNIASNLGGWSALDNLRRRLWQRGIRLASDMVPNHTGMDSKWVTEKPDLFIQRRDCPFPQYSFNGENLSRDGRTSVYLEDHYYSKTDCAVVFKRVDNATGDVRYIYHGNDGTGMPWNDTAQIDFLNPQAREEVIQEILHVARNFPIIRFDAAMVLAKKHIRRLWYPEPGHGGDIATRSETGLSDQQFEAAIPVEFWREVVDRVAREVPDTLLLAEAFWMMEGYFVRTLGMHRVYNSAFMNMLKREENAKYRDTVKNTLSFDPQVLKRFVNFMNNPDEETAVAQFGKGDKYFGVCTLMITMPGLPMFGHGQIEGFIEKYGMEYTKAYKDEQPDQELLKRHWRDIFPLMKKRYLFAEIKEFLFYDVWNNGKVEENIFAYSNGTENEHAVVFYNNKYDRACGWIKQSVQYAVKTGTGEKDIEMRSRSISEALGLSTESNRFCIFREHHSGLWFVRSSADICSHGMFVSLNGFEYQVLMDIQQVTDTPEGKYRILCETLAGKGTEDLEIEWKEICYKDLYKALGSFLSVSFITELHRALLKDDTAALEKILKAAEPDAIAFYKTAAQFAGQKETSKKDFTQFQKLIKRLTVLNALAVKQKKPKDYTVALRKASAKGIAEEFISVLLKEMPELLDCFACYAAVQQFADSGMASRWSLARKFTGYLQSAGIASDTLQQMLVRILLLASAPVPLKTEDLKLKMTAYKTALFLVESEKSPVLCGTNIYAGVHWFNKELSDSSLSCLTAMKLFTSEPVLYQEFLQLYRLLSTAKKRAAYNCELFIKPFTPRKTRIPKAAKPVNTSKPAKTAKPKTLKKKGQ